MPKKTYRVPYEGHTFTRKTERTYTHVVIVCRSYAVEHALAGQRAREQVQYNRAYHLQEADPATRQHTHSDEALARFTRYAAMTQEQQEAEYVAEAEADIERQRAKGAYDGYGPLTWCGRGDLAEKEAQRARGKGYYADVKVLPVPQPD